MTHATITPNTAILCKVAFDYAESTKEHVKALAGANYQAGQWIVPIMHLPTLKLIFSTMTVAPEVVSAYHALLKRMLTDLDSISHRKGKLGEHIAELQQCHAVGISAVRKTGWKPTPRPRTTAAPSPKTQTAAEPGLEDRALGILLSGIKNAHADSEKEGYIAHAGKRKRKKAA